MSKLKLALVGAGFMGQGLTNQIVHSVPGMRMVALFSRQVKKGFHIYNYAGSSEVLVATTQDQLETARHELSGLRAGREALQHRISLLDGRAIDPDLLDEVAHTVLLENRPGEVAVRREKR